MKKPLLAVLLFLALVPALVASDGERLPPPREPDVAPRPATLPAPALRTSQPVSATAATVPADPSPPSTLSPIAGNETGAIAMLIRVHANPEKFAAQVLHKAGYVYAVFRGDAESEWIAYAWPEEYGRTGRRTFMVNPEYRILATDSSGYSGNAGPFPAAAMQAPPGAAATIRDVSAADSTGADGNVWKRVEHIWLWRQTS